MENYFKKASNISEENENNYFNPAGDLSKENNEDKYFKEAEELEEKKIDINSNTIQEYLDRITSGITYRDDPNYQVLSGGGIITTFEKVKQMVDKGYNIIKSELISEINGKYLVSIEFEEVYENKKKSR